MDRKILILEDEISMNRGIAFSLERAGYAVSQCYSIAEAKLEPLESVELLICDINLPDGDGLDFVRWVRSEQKGANIHIICLTAKDSETDFLLGYQAGADDYVAKPFSLSVLMMKIDAYFRKNKASALVKISGNIKFNQDSMEVYLDGDKLILSRNEMKLLKVFLDHPLQLLSKNQLLEQAFDVYENYVDENTLAVNISRLRERLGDSAQNPRYIKNVRGLGYIWMEKVQ